MKSLKVRATFFSSLGVVLLGGAGSAVGQGMYAVAEDPPVTVAELEAALSPYGSWADVPGCGKTWRPDPGLVGDDFAPYVSNGQWVNGAYGWTFNSNDPWGWAAFHFGRWVFLQDQGWVWIIQGSVPSWTAASVDWRSGGGFVGWVPTVPTGVAVDALEYVALWNVVQLRNLQRPDLARHLLPSEQAVYLRAAAPPAAGPPVAPLSTWRGYPGLRAALAAQNGWVPLAPLAPGVNPTLWLGGGSSVHAPLGMGQSVGASPLWTGPGSSVFASPAFGESTGTAFGAPSPLRQQPRGWLVAPGRPSGGPRPHR